MTAQMTLRDLADEYDIASDDDLAALLALTHHCVEVCGEPSERRLRQVLGMVAETQPEPRWRMATALLVCDMIWSNPDGELTPLPEERR